MELSIRTVIIMVLGIIAFLIIVSMIIAGQSQGNDMIKGLFDWLKVLGGGSSP
jgi:hypothetical protein